MTAPAAPIAGPATGQGLGRWVDAAGVLLRERPDDSRVRWSQVPVHPEAGASLLARSAPREVAVVAALGTQHYLTISQLARRFYASERVAREHLHTLFTQRLVCRMDHPPIWMGRAVGATRRPPWIYFLDWNGKYALDGVAAGDWPQEGRPTRGAPWWRADRIAQPGSGVPHQLGLNELWSHLYAAARFTQRRVGSQPGAPTLMIGWQPEGAALVQYGAGAKQIIRPDAEVRVRIGPPLARTAPLLGTPAPVADWEQAVLEDRYWIRPADPGEGTGSEEVRGAYYCTLLVEFETGAHHSAASIAKIAGYNTLFQTAPGVWQKRYGRIPRVGVVVRDDSQVDAMVALWRQHYFMGRLLKPGTLICPVLVTSLPALRRAEEAGVEGALQPCWVHALDPEAHPPGMGGPGTVRPCQVLSLGAALGMATL